MFKRLIFILLAVFIVSFTMIFLKPKPSQEALKSPFIFGGSLANNLWQPQVLSADFEPIPTLTAQSVYFVDLDDGAVLYQKDPKVRLPIASLTKIMTVIVTLENHQLSDQISVSSRAAAAEPDHMELIAGEKLSVEELLYGVFLVSANDAAEALSENTLSSREEFIKQMNLKAKQLGMNDTLFINPTGLSEDGIEQYSTAYDVALMSRYLIKTYPEVVTISQTVQKTIPQTQTHQDYDLNSGINLLTTYPGVVGFKTGYTPEAGLTLVTLAKRDGHTVLGVILNAQDRRDDARTLLDLSFKKLGVKVD